MWFKMLGLLIGTPCLLKGFIGLLLPEKFYRWRHGQYASERPPGVLFVAPLALAAAVAVTWYATAFHYVPWGWVVTVFVSIAAVVGTVNLIRWQQHQNRSLRAVSNPATRRNVDLVLVGLGVAFVVLAIAVY
ncbi:hypothetical protein BH10PLA2_BH10PLA2_11350 [soil metagenome]